MQNNYLAILKQIRDKYGIDYSKQFKSYATKINNLKKGKKSYKDINYYLTKKAKRIAQTQEATYLRKTTRELTKQALVERWNILSRAYREGAKLSNKDIRSMQRYQKEWYRRKYREAQTPQEKALRYERFENLKSKIKIEKSSYIPLSSFEVNGTRVLDVNEYADLLGVSLKEAYDRLGATPLQQVLDGFMVDGYIDEEEKIIVYTK